MIKAILYDLGDIFFEAHYWRKWMWETLTRIGKYSKSFSDFYELYETYLKPVYENKKDYWVAYADFLEEFHLKDTEGFIKLSKMHKSFYEENRVLYEGVAKTLQILHQKGIKNIVITDNENGADWVKSNILERFMINEYIDHVVTSKETGVMKPDPKIFQYALNHFLLAKEEVLFVAHDRDEINGAEGIGIKSIELNNYLSNNTISSSKIRNFETILELL